MVSKLKIQFKVCTIIDVEFECLFSKPGTKIIDVASEFVKVLNRFIRIDSVSANLRSVFTVELYWIKTHLKKQNVGVFCMQF